MRIDERKRSGRMRIATAVAAVLSAWLVAVSAGCAMDGGAMQRRTATEERAMRKATMQQQRDWAAQQAAKVIEATRTEGEWHDSWGLGYRWPGDAEAIFEHTRVARCSFEPVVDNPSALRLEIWSRGIERDPFPIAELVRELWVAEGWEVSDVVGPGDTAAGGEVYFRADRGSGAFMLFTATEMDGFRMLTLTVQPECSDHPTVAH